MQIDRLLEIVRRRVIPLVEPRLFDRRFLRRFLVADVGHHRGHTAVVMRFMSLNMRPSLRSAADLHG